MGRYVVIGGSIGGTSLVNELRKLEDEAEVVVVDSDHQVPYRRPGASKGLVTGDLAASDLALPWQGHPKTVRMLGTTCVGVDVQRKRVRLAGADGTSSVDYDKLIIATGSYAVRPLRVPGIEAAHTIRTLADAERLTRALGGRTSAVIVGAGFLGLEVASSLRRRGLEVTVVEAGAQVLGGRFGSVIGDLVGDLHERHGVRILLNSGVSAIHQRDGDVSGVQLASGEAVAADVVVWATGGKPSVEWLGDAFGDTTRGLRCDAFGQVEDAPDVFAIGDVAEWFHSRYQCRLRVEHWTNAIDQAQVVARRLTSRPTDGLSSLPYVWSDQFDHKFQMLGLPSAATSSALLEQGPESTIVGYFTGERLIGAAGFGAKGAGVMRLRKRLIEESWSAPVPA